MADLRNSLSMLLLSDLGKCTGCEMGVDLAISVRAVSPFLAFQARYNLFTPQGHSMIMRMMAVPMARYVGMEDGSPSLLTTTKPLEVFCSFSMALTSPCTLRALVAPLMLELRVTIPTPRPKSLVSPTLSHWARFLPLICGDFLNRSQHKVAVTFLLLLFEHTSG